MSVPEVIRFEFPGLPNIRCAFQTRKGGYSPPPFQDGNIALTLDDDPAAVLKNRKALLEVLGVSRWAEEDQIHGDRIIFDAPATKLEAAGTSQADGLSTVEKDLALCIKTADCQPILLAHKGGAHVAALHCGWRGNRCNFPASGTLAFCARYQLAPADILAVRGPSLGPAAAEFVNFATEWGEEFLPWFDAAAKRLNLWALTRHQLLAAGLQEKNLFSVDLCTYAQPDLFFSYRRDGASSGRQASCIWIED